MTSKKRSGNDPLTQQLGDDRGSAEAIGRDAGAYLQGRRAMAFELLESGGLAEGRVGLEILYLLPDSFVNFYSVLFHKALVVDGGSVMHGKSGGLEKAAGAKGIVTGSEVGAQAKGGGKRWKNMPMSVGNEDALLAKTMIDKGLGELVQDAVRMLKKMERQRKEAGESQGPGRYEEQTGADPARVGIQCRGEIRVPVQQSGLGLGVDNAAAVRKCRRFLKQGWSYCPTCGTRTEQGR